MATDPARETVVLPEYTADSLGAPFKVILVDSVKQIINRKTGAIEQIIIPNQRGLYQQIALTRITVPRKLSGPEIKFIRKALPVKASMLAEKIGVTPEHFSRCEAGERVLSTGAEKCLRLAILLERFKIPSVAPEVLKENATLRETLISLQRAIGQMQSIIDEMSIPAAHDSSEEICLSFTIINRSEDSLFKDDVEEDWSEGELLAA